MSRLSSLVFGSLAVAIVATVSGCQVEASIKFKQRFVEPNVVKEDTADWAGQPIEIKIEGVGIAQNGGVTVTSKPEITKVRATARMLAMAFEDEKVNADQSIIEAKDTFTLSNTATGITVSCGHGGSHGSSTAGESGCELVEIEVPAGDAQNPLQLTKVLSGNGTLTLQLSNATLAEVGANSNGGDINADLPATQGGTISLVTEKSDNIYVKLPTDFAADEVILQADADKITLGAFTDVVSGQGRGEAGTGLKLLKLTSKEFAGSTGEIVLR